MKIAAVGWEAAAQISLHVLALPLLDRGCCSSATRCIVEAPGVAAARAAAAAAAASVAAGDAAAAGAGGPQEAIRPSRLLCRMV